MIKQIIKSDILYKYRKDEVAHLGLIIEWKALSPVWELHIVLQEQKREMFWTRQS